MEIPVTRWYPAIPRRRSRRRFDPDQPIKPEILAILDEVCHKFTPFPHARSILVSRPAKDIFKGIMGGYGKVTGAHGFIAFIGDMGAGSVQEEVGYTGEGIVLEATAMGLNTCWVAGFFRPESVATLIRIEPGERVLAVTPVGYAPASESLEEKMMTGFGRTHVRLPISKLISNRSEEKLPEWVTASIEAARLAPSAINRQPWSFAVQNDGITVNIRTSGPDFSVSKRLDCGIAMLHMELAAANYGIKGEWTLLPSPSVARFKVGI
jgi:nitroreductase